MVNITKMKPISNININFDSLGWALQTNPKEFDDPTFFIVADRFLKLADKYDFKYTIFVIGKDLENPNVAKMVKEWQDQGHEIGNHTYNHLPNFGSLSYNDIYKEVMDADNIISKACGESPIGFIAPGWAISKNLVEVLIQNNYLYDTSLFPSWFMYLAMMKLSWNFKSDKRRFDNLKRNDYIPNLLCNSDPFFTIDNHFYDTNSGNLLIMPLPTSYYTKVPCWHTLKFISPKLYNYSIKECLNRKYFYYLTHPADLMDLNDIPKIYHKESQVIERINIPLKKKIEYMEKAILTIKRHSIGSMTLSQIAREIYFDKTFKIFNKLRNSKTNLCDSAIYTRG
jgi:hypothetical protein